MTGTRNYNRRQAATQTPENAEPKGDDTPETVDETPETEQAKGDSTDQGDSQADTKDDAAKTVKVDAEKATEKPKRKTRAQVARDEAEKTRKAQDKATLDGAPTFEVTYPTGFSRYLPDDEEIEVTLSGGSKVWVDVENGHALIPLGGRMRALSVSELTDFTRLAGQSFLKLAPPD